MRQIVRTLTMAAPDGVNLPQVLICDRDRKWSHVVQLQPRDAGIRVVLIPERAPNANAYAERFVRSIKEECLERIIPLGERHFRHAIMDFVEHYHRERNHQGLDNRLIPGTPVNYRTGRVRCRRRAWRAAQLSMSGRRDRRLGRELEHYGLVWTSIPRCSTLDGM